MVRWSQLLKPALTNRVTISEEAEMSVFVFTAVGMLYTAVSAPVLTAPCAVSGVWALESVTSDGKVEPLGKRRQIKIITPTHYAWLSQEPGPTALRTAADSVAAFRTSGFGGGTYRVTDTTYTERLDYFADPAYVGREVTLSCRMAGNRWTAAFQWPVLENGRETRRVRVEEVWRRVQ